MGGQLAACGSSVSSGDDDDAGIGDAIIAAPDALADGVAPDDAGTGLNPMDAPGDLAGGDDGPGDAVGDAAEGAGADDTSDGESSSDTDEPPEDGQLGAPCDSNDECFSGFCVDSHEGKVCSKTCASDCPAGWACAQWAGGGDVSFICVPLFTTLCRPCITNGDCVTGTLTSGSRCLPAGLEGSFCGGACDGVDCPAGFSCEEAADVAGELATQCVPDEGICPCFAPAIALASATVCGIANDDGTCKGLRTCSESGLTPCSAAEPAAEVCDGDDDDCDQSIDEGFALGEACDGDDDDLCTHGTLACTEDGGVGCEEADHYLEVCDGADNDCDSAIDEGFDDLGAICDGDDDDLCSNGVVVCGPVGGTVCSETVTEFESCNSEDDDCDSEIDESLGLGEACDGDDGDLCANGVLTCGADGEVVCAETLEAGEGCNGLDDDCDGAIDETFPTLGQPCDGDDDDLCPTGQLECTAAGDGVTCGPEVVSDLVELCDGDDDDCDSSIDEGFDVGTVCDSADDDLCANGVVACDGAGAAVCEETVNHVETCDGDDDDCDSSIDEGFDVGTPCDGPDKDLCTTGTIICTASGGAECEELTTIVEVCDGDDDDCDAEIDEGFDVGAACDSDDADLCANGVVVCTTFGLTECEETIGTVEVCNGLDDDCDAAFDEGFGVGETCDGVDADLCANGVVVCDDAGGTVCQETASIVEVCNGVDDDCDGDVDEGFGLGTACDSNDADLCAFGTIACDLLGGTACVGDVDVDETCNGLDDDCDGDVDEGFGLGTACDSDDADLCPNGAVTCDETGGTTCAGDVEVTEVCNNQDDDCDSEIDETFTELGDDCDSDDADACANGTIGCNALGGTACLGDVNIPDVCNGLDDDCDSAIDETFPDLGNDCDTNDADECANGTITCNEFGGAGCTGDVNVPEVCNSLDDDCDSVIDETFPELGNDCDSDDADFCLNGVLQCAGEDTTACVETTSLEEGCGDDIDNDCDGDTDENCAVTTIVIPAIDSVGPPVESPAATGVCSHFGTFASSLDPHNAGNLPVWMQSLEEGPAQSTAEAAAATFNYGFFPATGCTAGGDFAGADAVPVSTGGALAARFRGFLNIPEYTVWTLLVIGNDSVRVTIGDQQIALLSWSGLGWKYSVDVSFETGGLYPIEVEWSSNQNCGIDPLEIAFAEGQVPGYTGGVMHCGPSTGGCGAVSTPAFQLLGGDVLISSTDGSAVTCARCSSDDDCPGTCNPVGLCE